MAWTIDNRFPDWGEAGESPDVGFFYEGGNQVNEKHLDYLWNNVNGLEEDVIAALNDIDSDGDGKVDAADAADTASAYKGNDIDSDGDGKVDAADSADVAGGSTGTFNLASDIAFPDADSDGSSFSMKEDATTGNLTTNYGGTDYHEFTTAGDVRIAGELTENASI